MAERDKTLDGFRAVAALGVVIAHAVDYRFASVGALHYAQRLADPLSQTSVQIFFVISGYIITTLLIKEREATGRISIPSFYIRRVCRIVPPLAVMLLTVAMLRIVDGRSLAMASTFTCNIGDCQWAVAHTWSLSVEEQFYLLWPLLLATINPSARAVAVSAICLLVGFALAPPAWHSNYVSFACIGAGAAVALSGYRPKASTLVWLAIAALLLVGPLFLPDKPMHMVVPLGIVYLTFGCPPWAKALLAMPPVQWIGGASYSLYLWQQLFFESGSRLPVPMLPVVVALSFLLIERPFIRLGRRLSAAASRANVHV